MRTWLGAGLISIAMLVAGPARASCMSMSFGQLTPACDGGTAYCYLRSPGMNATATILGSFWSLGFGNPAPGMGSDNGTWAPEEQWLRGTPAGIYLAGGWEDPRVDGCIAGQIPPGESAEIMTVAVSDTDVFNKEGFFAAAAVSRHAAAQTQFDFAQWIQEDILLAAIPLPPLGAGPTGALVQPVRAQDVEPGFYTDGAAVLSQVIVGYRVYYRDALYPPQDRHRSAWSVFSPVVPLGQPYSVSRCFCCGENGYILHFAVALVFANGFETEYVSRSRTVYPCNPEAVFDLDGDGDGPPGYFGNDCNDDDDTIYTNAPEINDGRDNQCPGNPGYGSIDEVSGLSGFYHPGDKNKFTWHSQNGASGYDVARSHAPQFTGACTTWETPLGSFTDAEDPPPNATFYYLVHAAAPHAGSWGTGVQDAERTVDCPGPAEGDASRLRRDDRDAAR
ncbi:MAG TPA: hypothetical protein VFV75_19705 [Candidatus Polarisedimenticolaceae bacterium]|nr:hypothetical protein [Candidatus Polarisedimenticolaceae bacterium]